MRYKCHRVLNAWYGRGMKKTWPQQGEVHERLSRIRSASAIERSIFFIRSTSLPFHSSLHPLALFPRESSYSTSDNRPRQVARILQRVEFCVRACVALDKANQYYSILITALIAASRERNALIMQWADNRFSVNSRMLVRHGVPVFSLLLESVIDFRRTDRVRYIRSFQSYWKMIRVNCAGVRVYGRSI